MRPVLAKSDHNSCQTNYYQLRPVVTLSAPSVQFHRFANLYFLFIVLLNWVPQINAFGKEISMMPVFFVLLVTAIKVKSNFVEADIDLVE